MADVTIDPENANPKELYGQGIRAYVLQDYDTAVKAFSKTSELLVSEHGSETHDSLGGVYLYYGKALLELSRKESGPLGEAVPKDAEEEDEEVEDEDEAKAEEEPSETKTEESGDNAEKEPEKDSENPENAEAAGSEEKKEGEEELTDLQVAWEVLELAKQIFTARGTEGQKNLADTLITLGEVSLESGNFALAIDDMSEGLKIQKKLFSDDSRTTAETFYKLGGAYSTNGQIDEALESFSSSLQYLKNKIANLRKDEEANKDEVEELNSLIPEIEEKILDMKNLKLEIANKVTETVDAAPKANGGEASSSKQVNDISHLVKRKRKGDEAQEETPAKKPSP